MRLPYQVTSNVLKYSNNALTNGYTGHDMVNDFEVIHMGGRTYNPVLDRFMQADPSGYLFSGLRSKIKKYWKVATAIAVTYFTVGAATGWVSAWGPYWGTAATAVTATTAATAATLTTAGSIAVGAIAGATGGFVGGALQTRSVTGALRGAMTGAIAGAAGGYANFGKVTGLGNAAFRVGVAGLGGCAAGEVSGSGCAAGARMAALTQAVTMGAKELYRTVSTKISKQTGQPYNEDGNPHLKQRGQSDVGSQLPENLYEKWKGGALTPSEIGMNYDKSQFMQSVGKGPYMDAFAEFHDGLHDFSFIPDDQASLILTMPPSYAVTLLAAAQPYSSYYHLRLTTGRKKW